MESSAIEDNRPRLEWQLVGVGDVLVMAEAAETVLAPPWIFHYFCSLETE